MLRKKNSSKNTNNNTMRSSNAPDAAERPRRSSSSYILLVFIILIVAAYTAMTMTTLDDVNAKQTELDALTGYDKAVAVTEPDAKGAVAMDTPKADAGPKSSSADAETDIDTEADTDGDTETDTETGSASTKEDKDGDKKEEEEVKIVDKKEEEEVKEKIVEPSSIRISTTASEAECENFDHGDNSPAPNVTSIFNCGSEAGTCHWYFPAKFFHPCGMGKEFIPQINDMKERYDNETLWLNGPPIVIPYATIDPNKMRSPNRFNGPWVRHNISMTHVHKTGGTSLVTSFSSILGKGAKGMRHTVYMPASTPPPRKKEPLPTTTRINKRPKLKQRSTIYGPAFHKASTFLDGAVKYRKEWGMTDHTLFAVVRDPADRFISAIGQATGAFGSTANGVGKKLVEECVKGTSKESLSCFVDLVQNNSTWVEVHFTPMVMEISFATIYKDIPVAVFPFTEVPNLMRELGSDPNLKKKDGHKKGYRKDEVLTNMQVSDYDEEMMKKLCHVYKMDAVFMHQIGMSNSCDPYVDYTEL